MTELIKNHIKLYKKDPQVFYVPHKINFGGDYTKHIGGNTLSICLDVGVVATVSPRPFESYSIRFENDKKAKQFTLNNLMLENNFYDLFKCVMIEFMNSNHSVLIGFDCYVKNEVPLLCGLTQDCSMVVLFTKIINQINNLNLSNDEIIRIANIARNKYNKTFEHPTNEIAIVNSKKQNACLISNKNNRVKQIKVNFEDFCFIIFYDKTNITYIYEKLNQRINEQYGAHAIIENENKYICDFDYELLNNIKDELRDEEFKRIRHAISENIRVNDMVDCLNKNNLIKFGVLLKDSQNSIYQDFEMSTNYQDDLCSLALRFGALGAKMISSEYNNSIFVFAKEPIVKTLIKNIEKEYKEMYGRNIDSIVVKEK